MQVYGKIQIIENILNVFWQNYIYNILFYKQISQFCIPLIFLTQNI